jgi:hypothetical protein
MRVTRTTARTRTAGWTPSTASSTAAPRRAGRRLRGPRQVHGPVRRLVRRPLPQALRERRPPLQLADPVAATWSPRTPTSAVRRLISRCAALERLEIHDVHRARNVVVRAPCLEKLEIFSFRPLCISVKKAPRLDTVRLNLLLPRGFVEHRRHHGLRWRLLIF